MTDDFVHSTAWELAGLYERNEASPVEVVEAILARIARLNGQVNAYISVTEESARREAVEAGRAIRRGKRRGPLHGVPVAIKDVFDTAGVPTTAGAKVFAGHIPTADAEIVRRLREAGAIVLGKTNLDEVAYGGTTENPHYGVTLNPWDNQRVAGGSSGGSAVALALDMCTVALGSDTAGSIRIPAACVGVVGLKPTYGLLPTHGMRPLAWSLDHAGTMGKCVRDVALMLDELVDSKGGNYGHAKPVESSGLETIGSSLQGIRVGVPRSYYFDHLETSVARIMASTLDVLQALGASLIEVEIRGLEGAEAALLAVVMPEASQYHGDLLRSRPEDYGLEVRRLLEAGEFILATHHVAAQRFRTVLRWEFERVLGDVDAVVTPTLPMVAPRRGTRKLTFPDGHTEGLVSALWRFTFPSNLAGLPSLSVPVGLCPEGMPVAVQLIGRPSDEGTLLHLGGQLEAATQVHAARLAMARQAGG